MSISRVLPLMRLYSRPPNRSGQRVLATVGIAGCLSIVALALPAAAGASERGSDSYLSHFSKVTSVASTVPGNGDVNPYGITVVPQSMGKLVRGDTLVSNFNNSANRSEEHTSEL